MTSGRGVGLAGALTAPPLDVRAAQALTADLMKRRQWIYWLDFALSWSALVALLVIGGWHLTWLGFAAIVPAALLVFRVAAFIHEIEHFRQGECRAFKVAWNTLFGCPAGIPHPTLDYHKVHHSAASYGTPVDPEYTTLPEPFPPVGFLVMLRTSVLYPLLVVFRFTVGTITLVLHRPLREKFERRLSAFHMDLSRAADPWTSEKRRHWLPFELTSLVYFTTVAIFAVLRVVPLSFIVYTYVALIGGNFINRVRVLFAHGYHTQIESRSFERQVADSFDHPSLWIFFWSPIGLGYHATHHLFPRMPYHALGKAHRRLAASDEFGPFIDRSSRPGLIREIRDKLTEGKAEARSHP